MRPTIAAAVLGLAPLGHALAQDPAPLAPNERVRVWREGANSERIDGRVVAVDGNTLTLSIQRFRADAHGRGTIDSVPTSIAIAAIDSVVRHTGRRSAGGKGAVIGGVSMGLVGAVGAAAYGDGDATDLYGVIGFSAIGAGVGWLIGTIMKRDQWEEVSVDSFQVGVVPRAKGIGIAATITF